MGYFPNWPKCPTSRERHESHPIMIHDFPTRSSAVQSEWFKLVKSRPHDMTLRRASCGFWALLGRPNCCCVCFLRNNDKLKCFRSYFWDLTTSCNVSAPVYEGKTRVGEEPWSPGPSSGVLNVSWRPTNVTVNVVIEIFRWNWPVFKDVASIASTFYLLTQLCCL